MPSSLFKLASSAFFTNMMIGRQQGPNWSWSSEVIVCEESALFVFELVFTGLITNSPLEEGSTWAT